MKSIHIVLLASILCSCTTDHSGEDPLFNEAYNNGIAANEGFRRCLEFTNSWLEHADSSSGLIPENLYGGKDTWNAHNSAADNYPFMVLSSYLLDKTLYETTMHQMLQSEIRLTSRLNSLPDDYSFSKQDFVREELDTASIVFGTSEYMKDGLIPLTEYLGPSPWSDRMIGMLNDLKQVVTIARNSKSDRQWNPRDDEINGELLQILSRIYWMTGDSDYLHWATHIGDYYLLEKRLDQAERIRLRDHGCEIIAGLSELYVALKYTEPNKAISYQPALYRIMDRILEVGRNADGMFYNEVNLLTGEILNEGIVDNWGYIYNAYYTLYLLENKQDYRQAVLQPLQKVNRGYRDFDWERGSADGFADAIESGINLCNREPNPDLKAWIDSETSVMWSLQDSSYQQRAAPWMNSGIIEGWHGDGNFARTSLMYCLWKTQDLTIGPWREDVDFGAVQENETLYISLTAEKDWEGLLIFGKPRHQALLHLPIDYPRINQFPEWYSVSKNSQYRLKGEIRGTYSGEELQKGIPIRLDKEETCHIEVTIHSK